MPFSSEFTKHVLQKTHSIHGPLSIQSQKSELDEMARRLETSEDYRVLRRVVPRESTPTPVDYSGKFGILLDLETTGLDANSDEIIEIAMVKFRYSSDEQITGIADTFQSFRQPSTSIPANIVELTGITDTMVAGHKIDGAALEAFVADANIVIAHNAGFDRRFAERSWNVFVHRHWACSMSEIDWRVYGFGGTKLEYLLTDLGYFHSAHRAIDDCHATLELLARPIPATSTSAFAMLMDRSRRKTFRIWAQNSPYDLKDTLKRRGYRWNDGTNGWPRSWLIDVEEVKRDAELNYLRNEVYQRGADIDCREITALDRFSDRA
jgi:DNA polymerase III subunit epsilon